MLSGARSRLATALRGTHASLSPVARRWLHASGPRLSGDQSKKAEEPRHVLDPVLVEFLVCPLSKKPLRLLTTVSKQFKYTSCSGRQETFSSCKDVHPWKPYIGLRYESSTNELINEELGIAYPIIDGIPNMIPQAARMIHQNKKKEEMEKH